MRWLTIDPTNRREAAYRAEKLKAIDAWWREFPLVSDRIAAQFSGDASLDLPAWMETHLGGIDPRLMWEFGPAISGTGHRLVITPEAEHWLRPLVGTLLERAPALDGWEYYPYRLADSAEMAIETVKSRAGSDISTGRVSASIDAGKIHLAFVLPQCEGPLDAEARSAAFVATETLLGEELLDKWIGEIEVAAPPRRGWLAALRRADGSPDARQTLPLEALRPRVEQLVDELRGRLPDAPSFRFIHDCEWSSYELHPGEHDDYSGRDDLLVAITGRPDVFEAAHGGGLFHSQCFTRHGETFCYLKLDGRQGLAGSRFADRAAIEDALNAALIPAQVGCAIGGGTGLRYSYIDLALTNLNAARQVIRDVLLEGGVPRRTWLLFFDSALEREWTGIHDNAPEPP
jgi:hypothetical protein